MARWLRLAVAALALMWAPFLYKELTRDGPSTEADGLAVAEGDFAEEEDDEEPVAVAPLPGDSDQPESPELEASDQPGPEASDQPTPQAPRPPEPGRPEMVAAALPIPIPPPPEDPGEDEPEATDEAKQEPVAIPASGPLAVIKAAFDDETRDSLWAADQEAKLSEMAEGAGFGEESLGDVECMRTVCRMALHVGSTDLQALAGMYTNLQAKHDASGLAVEPMEPEDGQAIIRLYVPREGYSIADLARK